MPLLTREIAFEEYRYISPETDRHPVKIVSTLKHRKLQAKWKTPWRNQTYLEGNSMNTGYGSGGRPAWTVYSPGMHIVFEQFSHIRHPHINA